MENPYRSSAYKDSTEFTKKARIVRGLLFGSMLAALGYALFFSIAVPAIETIRQGNSLFSDYHYSLIIQCLQSPDEKYSESIFAISLLMGLSGVVNFTPARPPGMVYSVARIGVAIFVGLVAMLFATILFNLHRQSYTSDPYQALRFIIWGVVPLGYTCNAIAKTSFLYRGTMRSSIQD